MAERVVPLSLAIILLNKLTALAIASSEGPYFLKHNIPLSSNILYVLPMYLLNLSLRISLIDFTPSLSTTPLVFFSNNSINLANSFLAASNPSNIFFLESLLIFFPFKPSKSLVNFFPSRVPSLIFPSNKSSFISFKNAVFSPDKDLSIVICMSGNILLTSLVKLVTICFALN